MRCPKDMPQQGGLSMSRTTRPLNQLDAQGRPLVSSGEWTEFRGAYVPGTTNLLYGGFARVGATEGSSVWQIFTCEYDASNNMTARKWPVNASGVPSSDFEFSWTNRAAYTYA